MIKLIVAGEREFSNYEFLQTTLDKLFPNKEDIEVVCGEAKGADSLGKRWAIENNIPVKSFPADWGKHGKSAGPIRNAEMAKYGTHLVAFWDGQSKGTGNMITVAKRNNLIVEVVSYELSL